MKKSNIFRKAIIQIKIFIHQKKYLNNGYTIKYIFQKYKKSRTLIIVFSGFPQKKSKAKYNYMRTLASIKANKLFILDDTGYENIGTYYLGTDFYFTYEKSINNLILNIREKKEIDCVITCGSSKGGYAAMYYGIKNGVDYIISGAQQYFIGDYLITDNHQEILLGIIGTYSLDRIKYLNELLKYVIQHAIHKPTIYLHYSKKEHTYEEHIKYLINDLNHSDFIVNHDIHDYLNHKDVSLYFPSYLKNTLKILIKEEHND